ncbi:MAG TPA: ATP synthase F0 subunit C [Pyrinomonadaceae bacterium]|jgi:F-type H+-transporting ATPase subunit c|nr:ATP synthase F0 subunit C [Pyrinomonadaceae bacterium]
MKNLKYLFFALLGLIATAAPALAQTGAGAGAGGGGADNEFTYRAYAMIAAGIGFGIAVLGGALGQGKIGASAVEGAARNPSAAGRIQTIMILGLALIESLVLFALLIVYTVLNK